MNSLLDFLTRQMVAKARKSDAMVLDSTIRRKVGFVDKDFDVTQSKARFLRDLLCDIPDQWIRLSEEELDDLFQSFGQIFYYDGNFPMLEWLSEVDSDAVWFRRWTLTHFGRRQVLPRLRETLPQVFSFLKNANILRVHPLYGSVLSIFGLIVRFEGGRDLFPFADLEHRDSVDLPDAVWKLFQRWTNATTSLTIALQIINLLELWIADVKALDAVFQVLFACPFRLIPEGTFVTPHDSQ